ncbi:MAG: NAD-dependent epimerase/dehydratase family protein [Candidatus Buchananbacteria bacterium]
MAKTVLITGATGFVGAYLANKIAKNDNVHIIIRRNSDTWRLNSIIKNLNTHYADLTNPIDVDVAIQAINPEIIYHFAAYGTAASQNDFQQIIKANTLGTFNLFQACKKINFPIFINTGSSSEYGKKNKLMQEADLLEPNTGYGIAKASQTLLAQHFGRENDLPIVTLRFFSVYGPYESPTKLMPRLITACQNHHDLTLTSPDSAHDFVFVDDVVKACISAANTSGLNGEIINIGSGKQTSLREVVDTVKALTRADDIKENWGAIPDPTYDSKTWVADITKAKRLLDWQPNYNLVQGLAETINWFNNNQKTMEKKYVV